MWTGICMRDYVMWKILIWLVLGIISRSGAGGEVLMRARSLEELQIMIKKTKTEKQLKTSCLLQLKSKKVPIFCYQWLKNQKTSNKSLVLSYLDEKCVENSQSLKNLEHTARISADDSLSLACKNHLKKKKHVLEYQLRDRAPEKLLKWYFKTHF